MPVCTKCKANKPVKEFYRDAQKRSGHRPDCKACSDARVGAWCRGNLTRQRYMAAYRAAHPESGVAARRAWCKKNIERRRDYLRKRRAGQTSQEVASFAEWHDRVVEFDSHCAFCLKKLSIDDMTADHFRPVARGGTHTQENLVPACGSCNFKKNDALVFNWVARGIGVAFPETT